MSYGLRLRIEYKDINEVLTQINVYQQDYAGIADVRYAHAAFRAEWGDSGSGNNLPIVYGSSVTVFLDAEVDYEFLYLYSANSKKHRVEIVKGGNLLGKWFVEPDSWNEPLIATPYPCQFTAYDGLGYLADVDYVPNGRKSVQTILEEILALTGLGLPVNVNIDWVEAGGSGYTEKTIDTDVFEDMSCYDVLEQLFEACRIYQRAGEWRVETNKAISEKAANCDPWVENEPSMEILPALKQLTVVQDYSYQKNVIVNGSFDRYNKDLALFETWQNDSSSPKQYELNTNGDKYIFIPGKQYPDTYKHEGYGLITHGVSKALAVKQTDSKIIFETKYALLGSAYSCLMFIGIKLIGSAATYFLRRERYFETPEPRWQWVDYATGIAIGGTELYPYPVTQGADHICLKSHAEESATKGVTRKHPYYNTYDNVTAYPIDQIVDHFESFKASIDGFPVSGQLDIHLYVPYTNRAQHLGACYTGVTMELLDENEDEYPTKQTFVVVNDPANNEIPDDLNLKVGDYPQVTNNKLIYKGGFRQSNDDDVTTLWRDSLSLIKYTFAEFIGRNIVASQSKPRESYQVRLADVIPLQLIVVEDSNNPGKRFVENGFVYNDDYQACEGSFSELIEMDIDAPDVEGTTSTYVAPKTKPETKTATVKNIEERVNLIDESGALVSSPGYMYSKDFEIKKQDPESLDEDGKTRIQIKKAAIAPYNLDQAAGQLQFSMTSVAEVNYNGNPNQVKFNAGHLLIHNYNALDKDSRLIALSE